MFDALDAVETELVLISLPSGSPPLVLHAVPSAFPVACVPRDWLLVVFVVKVFATQLTDLKTSNSSPKYDCVAAKPPETTKPPKLFTLAVRSRTWKRLCEPAELLMLSATDDFVLFAMLTAPPKFAPWLKLAVSRTSNVPSIDVLPAVKLPP